MIHDVEKSDTLKAGASFDPLGHWSGRGHDVYFDFDEGSKEEHVPLELPPDGAIRLGSGTSGHVFKVYCQGNMLAKKDIHLQINQKEENPELVALRKFTQTGVHRHVTSLVGSFSKGHIFTLLLWPVCVCDLKSFLTGIERCISQKGPNLLVLNEELSVFISSLGIMSEDPGNQITKAKRCILSSYLRSLYACIVTGLKHIHDNNVVHHDFKAANILLRHNGPYITDFGLSNSFDDKSTSQTQGKTSYER